MAALSLASVAARLAATLIEPLTDAVSLASVAARVPLAPAAAVTGNPPSGSKPNGEKPTMRYSPIADRQ
jgi:uncharacterized RDD family membrane protein YckC